MLESALRAFWMLAAKVVAVGTEGDKPVVSATEGQAKVTTVTPVRLWSGWIGENARWKSHRLPG